MLWLLLVSGLHAQELDLPDLDWDKPEGELPAVEDAPAVSCCGFDRTRWEAMIREVLPEVRACVPDLLPDGLRFAATLTVEAGGNEVTAEVRTEDAALTACLEDALGAATWPGDPAPCTFRVTYPFAFAPS